LIIVGVLSGDVECTSNSTFARSYKLDDVCRQTMENSERTRFDEMAERDKVRFENDMKSYELAGGSKQARRKKTKDPSAPKRAL